MKEKYLLLGVISLMNTVAWSAMSDYFKNENTFMSIAAVGGHVWSKNFRQSHAAPPPNEFIPSLNRANINDNAAGLQAEIGYQTPYRGVDLRASLQFLYLSPVSRAVLRFYNTTAFASAFTTNTAINALTLNIGAIRELAPRVSFYGDAGIGAAFLNAYSTYASDAGGLNVAQAHTQHNTNFTWRIGGGGIVQLNKTWALNVGLHYASFGKLDFGKFASSPSLPNGVTYNAGQLQAWMLSVALELAPGPV